MFDANNQDLSTAMSIISAKTEGLPTSKASMPSEMCKREHCHCLCLQETHRAPHLVRPNKAGMTLISERPHIKYGSAILIRNDLKVKSLYVWEHNIVDNGEAVEQWADSCNLTLIHNAKLSFNDKIEAEIPTSFLYMKALLTCVENESWNMSLTRNTARSVHVQTR